MDSGPTRNLVIRLRTIREERDLSISDLMAKLEEQNTHLSESTLRRVFNDDIDALTGFSYEGTLMPLCDLLLPKGDTQDSELSQARIDGLLDVIAIKNQIIESLTKQIEELKNGHANRCRKCEKDLQFYRDQIDLKDHRMDKKDEWIDKLIQQQADLLSRLADKML